MSTWKEGRIINKLIECLTRLIKSQKVKVGKCYYGYYKIDSDKATNHYYFQPIGKKVKAMRLLSKKELKKQLEKALNKGYNFDIGVNRYNLKVLIDNDRYVLYRVIRKDNPYIHMEKLLNYDDLETINQLIKLVARSDKN